MIDALADALLPPAILPPIALLLLFAGRRRAAALTLAALALLSVEAVPHRLVAGLLLPPRPAPERPPGAIVVLASDSPGLLDTSRTAPSIETLKRLRTAAALQHRTGTPILVSGARASDGPVPTATAMARSLQSVFGGHAAWVETASTNQWQSAAATATVLRAAAIGEIYFVAEPWEVRLSAAIFESAGLDVVPETVPHDEQRPLTVDTLVTITSAWLDSAAALRQWLGLACQATPLCVASMRS